MLGTKLKVVRKERNYSLEELAKRTGFSKSFLSQIENGKNSPSIASLKKITEALGISIGELFEEDRGDQVYIQRKAERHPMEGIKDKVIFEFVSSRVANRKMEPLFFSLLPGGGSEGEYSHDGEEFLYIMAGTADLILDDERLTLEAGDCIYFDSSLRHRLLSRDGSEVKVLAVVSR